MGVKIKVSKDMKELLKGKIIKDMQSKKILDQLANVAIEQIYKRTKTGKGLSDLSENAKITSLEKLSTNYIDYRKGKSAWYKNKTTGKPFKTTNPDYIKKPMLGEFGTPTKSNLTLTGKMLDSIKHKISGSVINIFMSDKDSKKKAEYAHEGSSNRKPRLFFGLAKAEQKVIIAKLKELIRLQLKRFNR